LQLKSAEAGQLDIRNEERCSLDLRRLQKLLRRDKRVRHISQRRNQVIQRSPNRLIVIHNGYHRGILHELTLVQRKFNVCSMRPTRSGCTVYFLVLRYTLVYRRERSYAGRFVGLDAGSSFQATVGRIVFRKITARSTKNGSFTADSKRFRNSYQIGERFHTHLSHNVAAMDLHCYLFQAEFLRDMLVHLACRHTRHDLPLALA